jgi:hypothetical protein
MLMFFVRKRAAVEWMDPPAWQGLLFCLEVTASFLGHLIPPLGAYLLIYLAVDAPFEIKNATRFWDRSYGSRAKSLPRMCSAGSRRGGNLHAGNAERRCVGLRFVAWALPRSYLV